MTPHFGAFIDPHLPLKRSVANGSFQVPTFFQSRVHPKHLEQIQGPLLWMPGSGNDLLEKGSFDGGWNVSTFLVSLAYHVGCNPIVLVGVDLCQEKKKSYAGDLERTEEGELIPLPNGQYTRRDWLFAAEWLCEFAKEHQEIEWINASEGMAIGGYQKRGLDEVAWGKQRDICAAVHNQVQLIPQGIEPDVDPKEMQKSFAKMGALCEEMLALFERVFPELPEKSGEYPILEEKIEKERDFQLFLRPIWNIWKFVLSRQIPKDIPPAYGIGLNQWLFMKGICDDVRKI